MTPGPLSRRGFLTLPALADAHGVNWRPHVSTGAALSVAASLHLSAVTDR